MAKEERRIQIVKAASRVFYLKGFEGTKIEDVAKEAGIGKGTVYEYFESKRQLFEEMVIYNRDLHLMSIHDLITVNESFRDRFLALAKYQTKLVKEHIQVFSTMACSKIMAREMGALFLEHNIRVSEILKNMVIEAIKKGELRHDLDPDMVSSIMMGTVNQYCSKKVIFYDVNVDDIDFNQLVDTVIYGVGNSN